MSDSNLDSRFFDTQTLARLVVRCFDLSVRGAVPPDVRAQYLEQGKRLRELLMRMLGARFDASSAAFKKASDALKTTADALDRSAKDLQQVTQAVARLGELAGYLDQALQLAGKVLP